MEFNLKDLIKEGKSEAECLNAILENDADIQPEEALKQFSLAKKSIEIEELSKTKKLEEQNKAQIEAEAQKIAEKALEKIEIESVLEKAISTGRVVVKENEHAWKADQAKMFKSLADLNKYGPSHKSAETISELRQKFANVWDQKVSGIVTDSDPDGGSFVRPEFDMEVDKLVYRRSELLEKIQIRRGGEKTDINSISTFDFTNRADQNTAFTETKPAFDQERLEYRETGGIVAVGTYHLNGSEYNIIDELMEQAADAKFRHMEPAITTGKVSDGDFFDGMRFKAGVVAHNIIDFGTGGKLVSKDLTNAYLKAASQTRKMGSFILDTRELCLLLEERDNQNLPIETIINVNGSWVHKKTGRPIVVSDLMSRVNTALTSNTGGTEVGAFYGDLSRFRIYQQGAMDVAQSDQVYWKENQIGIRFILRYKFGIPVNSLTSFVTLQGVLNNEIS